MSTLKNSLNLLAWTLAIAFAGCSSTNNMRLGADSPSQAKTTLAIGGKPITVVTGTPGSSIAAETEAPVGPRLLGRSESRVSGRVYDADGAPVANANVRLAVSGALGGKDVQATTDRSGAFTLRGLRPGTTYTVIAETQGPDGKQIGRVQARASDTDVSISLIADQSSPDRPVRGVSNRKRPIEEDGQDDEGPPRIEAGVNEEDLPPPVEAEAVGSNEDQRPSAAAPRTAASRPKAVADASASPTRRRGEWGSGASDRAKPATNADETDSPLDVDARGTAAPPTDPVEPEDNGPNPLPPAIDRPKPRSVSKPKPVDPPASSSNEEVFVPGPKAMPEARSAEPDPLVFDPSAVAALESDTDTRSASAPSPFAALVANDKTPDPPTPGVTDDESTAKLRNLADSVWPGFDASESPAERQIATSAPDLPANGLDRTPPTARRPTWGEIATGDSRSGPIAPRPRVEPGFRRTSATASPGTDPKVYCDYDDRHRKLNDFQLPDLDGKPLRFKDIDADLVLIDFWGTWCAPCLGAIPHLVELQDRLKDKKVLVLGIACERDGGETAAARVADTARRLNINYPVLLSKNDGSCPLQEALHIQAFPTMLLVDRQGRVLWRDQGATPTTLARLDRVLSDSFGK